MIIQRKIQKTVENALQYQAAVALIGPRQVGKTTLAFEISKNFSAVYLDLEAPTDRAKLTDPLLFFEKYSDKLIILDEIHRMPDIFQILRSVIDKGRREQNGIGRFLILGSASIDLLKQSSETLAGRISYVEMTPLTIEEIGSDLTYRDSLWVRGGFPSSYLAANDQISLFLRLDFIRTYLEREIPLFGPRIPTETMGRLWTMLAHNHGGLLNASYIARSLSLSAQSITRYIDLLVDLLLVRRLSPYFTNVGKRLIKAPKIYIRDTGIMHALLNLSSLEQLLSHPIIGTSWEGFVIENIVSTLPTTARAYFYRTVAGAEMDLIIEFANQSKWCIEIKRSISPKLNRGFYQACNDLTPTKIFVVHASDDNYPLGENIEVVSLPMLLKTISI